MAFKIYALFIIIGAIYDMLSIVLLLPWHQRFLKGIWTYPTALFDNNVVTSLTAMSAFYALFGSAFAYATVDVNDVSMCAATGVVGGLLIGASYGLTLLAIHTRLTAPVEAHTGWVVTSSFLGYSIINIVTCAMRWMLVSVTVCSVLN